jgi:twinkle protein
MDEGIPAKDLNDVLKRDGSQGVVRCLNTAEWLSVPSVKRLSELPSLPPDVIYDVGSDERGLRLLNQSYRMRLGDLAVVTGVPGLGKTAFVNDLVCRVCDHYGVRAAWASLEQRPQSDHARNLSAWFRNGDDVPADQIARWIDDHHTFLVPGEDGETTLEWLLEAMETAVVRDAVKIVVIDPWNELEHERLGHETEHEYCGRVLRTFKRFSAKFAVHMIVVAHPAKLQKVNGKYGMPSLYDIAGSSHFYNKPDVGIIIHRETRDSTTINVQKVRYHDVIGRPAKIAMDFTLSTRRYTETERLEG